MEGYQVKYYGIVAEAQRVYGKGGMAGAVDAGIAAVSFMLLVRWTGGVMVG